MLTHSAYALTGGAKFTWADRKKAFCDEGSGEKALPCTSFTASDEEACKKSCEDTAKCQSVTYWISNRWCSHFRTQCKATKATSFAISIRLSKRAAPAGRSVYIGNFDCWDQGIEITFAFPKCQCESAQYQLGVLAKTEYSC